MSQITSPVVLDASFNTIGEQIVEKLHKQNVLLNVIAKSQVEEVGDMSEIASIVRGGHAADVFSVGDQIIVPWTDPVDNQTFSFVWNVAHIPESVTLQDGETVPGMYLVANYAHRYGIPFSAPQSIQYFENGLSAGTYYLTFEAAFGSIVAADGKISFTLTKDIPAGGQLAASMNSSKALSEWTISSYASSTASVALETVTPTAGQSGTSLGTLSKSNARGLNQDRASYGDNRYRDSAIRQWLNSDAGAGSWWTPQHDWDRPPAEAATKSGFLAGFEPDFLVAVGPTKVDVACNTVCDGGTTDTMYDRFFLPSLEQMFFAPQAAGVEGDAWTYYKRASLSDTALPTGTAFAQMRHFGLENHANAQYVRLRSANRGNAGSAFYVGTSGNANYGTASSANRALAACCIC